VDDDTKKQSGEDAAATVCRALEANGMTALRAADRAGALTAALGLIRFGDTVCVGGSVTLEEIGLIDALRRGAVPGATFLDGYRPGIPREEALTIRHQALAAEIFFSGTNAVTLSGELVNMDAFGNRVAALTFGPARVCIVAGVNKIVPDVPAALRRIKTVAAPRNCRRLKRATPCRDTGICNEAECREPERICNVYSVIRRRPLGSLITVILVGEELGY